MIQVYYAQAVEQLALVLSERMSAARLSAPLAILQPIPIVVSHPALGRWLAQFFSERLGICANVEFLLLGQWLDRMAASNASGLLHTQQKHDELEVALQFMSVLSDGDNQAAAEQLDNSTQSPDQLRWQSARRMARLYGEYQIYRADWFDPQFQAPAFADNPLQAQFALMQAITARFGAPQRIQQMRQIAQALEHSVSESVFAHVFFGFNHFAPDVQQLLAKLSDEVEIYFATPCEEYWADTVKDQFLLFRSIKELDPRDFCLPSAAPLETHPETTEPFPHHFEVGHALLSELGTHGQKHFAALGELSDDWILAQEHSERTNDLKTSQLRELQRGLRQLDPMANALKSADGSIRIARAPDRLSELRAVKRLIAQAMQDDPSLHWEDIAIMCPNVSAYQPLLASAFGPEGDDRLSMPIFALDQTQIAVDPILPLLLQAPLQRWTLNEFAQLIELPCVQARFDFDPDRVDRMRELLQRARLEFGLDERHLTEVLNSANDNDSNAALNTWQAALDRLNFGLLHGSDESETTVLDVVQFGETKNGVTPPKLYPCARVHAGHAADLRVLIHLVRSLRLLYFGAKRRQSVAQWCSWLQLRLNELALLDDAGREAVRALFTHIEQSATACSFDTAIDFTCLREIMGFAMQQSQRSATQRRGMISFCGLVPMRCLPFRVIAVVGLNAGDFPRIDRFAPNSLLQLQGWQRKADRVQEEEDRYMLLETICAARDCLWLSFVANTPDDAARTPGMASPQHSPLDIAGASSALNSVLQQLQTQFPHADWLETIDPQVSILASSAIQLSGPCNQRDSNLPKQKTTRVVKLQDLLRFWLNPLAGYCRDVMQIALNTSERQDHESEGYAQIEFDAIDGVLARRLRQLARVGSGARTEWLTASGLKRAGTLGELAELELRESVAQAAAELASALAGNMMASETMLIDQVLGDYRLIGSVSDCFASSRLVLQVGSGLANGRHVLQALIRSAALNAGVSESLPDDRRWRCLYLGKSCVTWPVWQPDAAREYLEMLIRWREEILAGAAGPPWFWPNLSHRISTLNDPQQAWAKCSLAVQGDFEYETQPSGLPLLIGADWFRPGNTSDPDVHGTIDPRFELAMTYAKRLFPSSGFASAWQDLSEDDDGR
jgi:exodeoxyribonuclease V gamma subunit